KVTSDKQLADQLVQRFEPIFGEEKKLIPEPYHVDHSVFGAITFDLYMPRGDQKYYDMGKWIADNQWQVPDSAKPVQKEYAARGLSWQTRMWIDDMFMITAVQAQAFRATKDPKYIERAANE